MISIVANAIVDLGELELTPLEPYRYELPVASPKEDLVLVGQSLINCRPIRLVWPIGMKQVAREVENWDDRRDLQARLEVSGRRQDELRWHSLITPNQFIEVRFRATERVVCEPALLVEEEPSVYSQRQMQWLLPLKCRADHDERRRVPNGHMIADLDIVFRGFRLLCEASRGSLGTIRVQSIRAANIDLLVGDTSADVAAGIFSPAVSPEITFQTMYPGNRFSVTLCNIGMEPARVHVRIEGKELKGVW
jgi:hypothetical protein